MKNTQSKPEPFSTELERWLKSKQPKTLASLMNVFKDKSFAIVILLLMLIPALPIPTGGVTHVFEIITMLLSLELIAGVKKIWLPEKWKNLKLGKMIEGKAIPLMLKRIRWFEKHSSPRGKQIFELPLVMRLIGLLILGLTIAAFLSPPFSGLDTLPSLGVVIICLSLILEDAALLLAGTVIGAAGVVLSIGFGKAIVAGIHRLLHKH